MPAPDQEIELKLALPRTALKQAIRLVARLPGAQLSSEETLEAVYFDTPKRDLRRAGMVLRLRAEQGRMLQTVKSDGDGSLARGEWSDPVDTRAPDPKADKSGRKIRRALGKAKLRRLAPQFTVKVVRTKIPLRRDGAMVEVAIDRGEIVAGKRKEPISEVELELKDGGSPVTLYALALRLAQALPVRVEARSKAERGFAAVSGEASKAVRSAPIALKPGDTLGEALRAAGRQYLGQFEANVAGALAADMEAVHQMRVALRRLRGVLGAAKKALPPLQYEWINDRLKTVLQRLGPARNWDVLREKLAQVPDATHRRTAAHKALTAAADREKQAAHSHAAEALTARATTVALLEVRRWLERLASPEGMHAKHLGKTVKKAAPALLDRQFKKMRKRARGFDTLSPEERHKLRIAAKNMRYTADFFASLYPAKDVKRFLKILKPVQEALGALNDVRGAHDLLDREKGRKARAAGEVLGWMDRDAADMTDKARKALTLFCQTKPYWETLRSGRKGAGHIPSL